ncbi:hypothetical protein [Amphibacillus cookii]|uniref:hypothetical protein n=1 Tax=Amphibacillus cookii TaxID=767787 RepID=UPI0019571671|nr:hypothetical protein [Amphibacillus cookii]MBM7541144.1 hypothetical protein [Amphibacillus cookii]
MLESSIMETGKMYISMVLIVFMIAMAVFVFQVQQSNHFTQYVNYQIERGGGLTETVIDDINDYSEAHFNGIFSISQSQATGRQPFGTVVQYTAEARLQVFFFEFDRIVLPINGSATTMVR